MAGPPPEPHDSSCTGMVGTSEHQIKCSHTTHPVQSSRRRTDFKAVITKVLLYMGVFSASRSVGSFGFRGVRQREVASSNLAAKRLLFAPPTGVLVKHIRLLYLLAGFPSGSISLGPHSQVCPAVALAATMEPATSNPLLQVLFSQRLWDTCPYQCIVTSARSGLQSSV
jgi:hypothetical protein